MTEKEAEETGLFLLGCLLGTAIALVYLLVFA